MEAQLDIFAQLIEDHGISLGEIHFFHELIQINPYKNNEKKICTLLIYFTFFLFAARDGVSFPKLSQLIEKICSEKDAAILFRCLVNFQKLISARKDGQPTELSLIPYDDHEAYRLDDTLNLSSLFYLNETLAKKDVLNKKRYQHIDLLVSCLMIQLDRDVLMSLINKLRELLDQISQLKSSIFMKIFSFQNLEASINNLLQLAIKTLDRTTSPKLLLESLPDRFSVTEPIIAFLTNLRSKSSYLRFMINQVKKRDNKDHLEENSQQEFLRNMLCNLLLSYKESMMQQNLMSNIEFLSTLLNLPQDELYFELRKFPLRLTHHPLHSLSLLNWLDLLSRLILMTTINEQHKTVIFNFLKMLSAYEQLNEDKYDRLVHCSGYLAERSIDMILQDSKRRRSECPVALPNPESLPLLVTCEDETTIENLYTESIQQHMEIFQKSWFCYLFTRRDYNFLINNFKNKKLEDYVKLIASDSRFRLVYPAAIIPHQTFLRYAISIISNIFFAIKKRLMQPLFKLVEQIHECAQELQAKELKSTLQLAGEQPNLLLSDVLEQPVHMPGPILNEAPGSPQLTL